MKPFRKREQTEHPDIPKYIFTDAKSSAQFDSWVMRYAELRTKADAIFDGKDHLDPREKQRLFRKSSPLTEEETQEIRMLRKNIRQHKNNQRGALQSILSRSDREDNLDSGKDNVVYGDQDSKRYVSKYSVGTYMATPSTIEYLQKKYAMLKKYMGCHIPDSGFILGERRITYHQAEIAENADKRTCAVTIQRRVKGKTFQQMSFDEKTRLEVVQRLADAHRRYMRIKSILQEACRESGLSEDALDAKLDIGYLSKHENVDMFDPEKVRTFDSPNIMYDEEEQQIMFVDFDMNEWSADKEKVFTAMMSEDFYGKHGETDDKNA